MISTYLFYIFLISTLIQLLFWIGIYARLAVYNIPPNLLKGELSLVETSERKFEEEDSSPYKGLGGKKLSKPITTLPPSPLEGEQSQDFKNQKIEPINPALKDKIPISIIICAHNEFQNLQSNLPRILNQNYRSYEVLVVCHNCTDESETFLIHLSKTYKNLRIIILDDKKNGKKSALARGIEEAQHEVLLLTDADCYPISKNWLYEMQLVIRDEVEIGLGYAPLEKSSGFLNHFIRYETNFAAMQYLSFALAGMPYMGVGRNLIYKKSLFKRTGGFEKHAETTSGDDDLFVNAAARPDNTKIVLSPDSFVYSPAKKTWRDWFRQKSRHLTTGRNYRPLHQSLLGLAALSHFLHYAAGMAVIFYFGIIQFLIVYLIRQVVVLIIFRAILTKLHDAKHTRWLPLMDAAHIFYYIFYSPTILFGHQKRIW